MENRLMKKIQLFVCLLALCNLTLFAQTVRPPRVSHTTEKSATHVPLQETPATLKGIYSNLGRQGYYSDTGGWTVSGPASKGGSTQFIAIPFTPKTNAHVTQVGVAVQYISGANQVNVSLYGDTGGFPGR